MRWSALILVATLTGCIIREEPERPSPPPSRSCPAPALDASPQPVWPDTCVADWYAKAALPPCVESYLTQLKSQQKAIAKGRKTAKSKKSDMQHE